MDARNTFIGGSDVGAIMGVSPYRGPVGLWRLKMGREAQEDAPILRAGHHFEPFVFSELTRAGYRVRQCSGETVRHPHHEWAGATLDGYIDIDGDACIVDAKMSRKVIDPNDPTTIPDEWVLQMHHYAWVTGISRAFLGVCNTAGGFEVTLIEVPLDLGWYQSVVVPRLAEFWACVVEDRIPEPAPYVERDPIPEIPEAADAVARYTYAADAEKAASEAKDAARADILRCIDAAGRPKKVKAGGATISVVQSAGRETIDAKGLREAHPDIAATFTRTGEPSVSIRVTKGKTK